MTQERIKALEDALKLALDYVEGCKVNKLPDLGVASSLPYMDDVLCIGDAALAASQPALDCHQPDLVTADSSQPAQPAAVTVKPLVWIATGDGGDFMAYDPLFERQVLSLEPAAYDTERVDRIMAALDVQPITVQDAARVPEIAALIEGIEMARRRLETIASDAWHGDARDFKRGIVGVFCEFDAGLRAIAEGRA